MSNQEFVNDLSRSYDSTGGNNGRHIMMASRSEDYRSDDDHLLNVLSTDEGDGSFNRSEFVEVAYQTFKSWKINLHNFLGFTIFSHLGRRRVRCIVSRNLYIGMIRSKHL